MWGWNDKQKFGIPPEIELEMKNRKAFAQQKNLKDPKIKEPICTWFTDKRIYFFG